MAKTEFGRVLVIDADAGERDSCARVLSGAGFAVEAAASGADAAVLLRKERFDAVLGSVSPRAAGGSGLVRAVRKLDKDLPVILLTESSGAAAQPAVADPSIEWLSKPVAPGLLQRTVQRAVRQCRRRRSLAAYRNRRGEDVAVASFTATEAKNEFGRVLQKATQDGIVIITRHDEPEAVVLSFDEFNELAGSRERELDTLSGEFDALLAKMQTPAARKGMKAAFDATPARMGEAAVAAARKRG